MNNFFYQPDNAWVGDLIPFYDNGTYYAFYLHDPRHNEDRYAEDTCWHLTTTTNFSDLNYHGVAIPCAERDKPNNNAYTGSVIKDEKGIYHAFFTAYNPSVSHIDGKAIQAVMEASGEDLFHLKVNDSFYFTADDHIYEMYDWRDPCVFRNEEENCYYMLLCARKKGAGALRGGCLALCKSKDLVSWSYEQPFYEPHMFVTMECPDLFRWGSWYYLVFSTFNDRFTTHYRVSKNLKGPWIVPEIDTFDSRANYAIKTAGDGARRYLFGWIPSRKACSDFGPWEWGGTMVFHELVQKNDGSLLVKPTGAEDRCFSSPYRLGDATCFYADAKLDESITLNAENLGAILYDAPGDSFMLEMELVPEKTAEFGLAVHTDDQLEEGYFLRMKPGRSVAWDLWPRIGVPGMYQWQIAGDVPYQIDSERPLPEAETYKVKLIREKDIAVVYINDQIAMCYRMYNHSGGKIGAYLLQGTLEIRGLSVKTGIS